MIIPDDKNWTWVLERDCPECGFRSQSWPREQVGGMTRAQGPAWAQHLAAAGVAERPNDDRWSTLEYACHVRDVVRLYRYRLGLMLDQDDPLFPNWDQDATAIADRYGEQDPAIVATELIEAADDLGDAFDGVSGEQWLRVGRRSDGVAFTVESFSPYVIQYPLQNHGDGDG